MDANGVSPAEHILGMDSDSDVYVTMRDMARERQLGQFVRRLNRSVLDGRDVERDKAIAALSRMGLWFD